MRIIKFRGKSILTGKWVYGDLIQMQSSTHIHQTESGCRVAYNIQYNTIGEYTGLKDKNDKEIYEGDIIKDIDYGYMICIFKDGTFIWYSEKKFGIKFMNYIPTIEVIGNIHENPELLEEG